jgi:hypothetical protein
LQGYHKSNFYATGLSKERSDIMTPKWTQKYWKEKKGEQACGGRKPLALEKPFEVTK